VDGRDGSKDGRDGSKDGRDGPEEAPNSILATSDIDSSLVILLHHAAEVFQNGSPWCVDHFVKYSLTTLSTNFVFGLHYLHVVLHLIAYGQCSM
jgi:hypothetical protein